MKVYEFRKDMKRYFDLALGGKEVYIERGGVVYRLSVEGTVLTSNLKDMVVNIDTSEKDIINMTGRLLERECKNGHAIPEGRDKCLGKSCKYS